MKTINTKENQITLHTKDTIIEEDIVVNFEGSSGGSGGGEVGDGFKIRYIDVDGTVLKTEYVPSGGKLTPPSNPTYDSEYLEFDTWNYDVDNYIVNGNTDVGAVYRTKTGDTYLFIRLTENIGLTIPTLKVSGATSIDWGDGTVDTNLTHTYSDYGDYVIKISGMTQITYNLFGSSSSDYTYCLQKCYLGDGITNIADSAFTKCKSLSNVSISNSMKNAFGYKMFSECISLISAIIPNGTTTLGTDVFYQASSLINVVIPETLKELPANMFNNCRSLTSFIIPNGITRLNNGAFMNCVVLKNIVVPSDVEYLGGQVFNTCTTMKNYIINCSSVPTLEITNAFRNINKATIIWVKDELVESYKSATNWSEYATYIKPISAMPQKLKEELGVL